MQDTSQGGPRSKVRWVVAGLMWAAIAINYIDRTVLSEDWYVAPIAPFEVVLDVEPVVAE